MTLSLKRTLLPVFAAFLGLLACARPAQADPVVLAVNYASPDVNPHIGSSITVYMSAVLPSATLSLTVISATSAPNQLVLSGTALASLAGQTIYVTDSQRVWDPIVTGGVVTLNNGSLLSNNAPFQVADYSTLANQSFRSYTGTLVTPSNTPGASGFVDIARIDSVPVSDPGNGVWSGVYFVTNLGLQIQSGLLYGTMIVGGLPGNSPFPSATAINIDGLLPAFGTVQFATTKPLYKGLLYIGASCVGTTVPALDNGQGRFNVTVNKRDTFVDVHVLTSPPTDLSSLVIPDGATTLSGAIVWDGKDGNGNYVADGVYTAQLGIRDLNGVHGVTRTAQIQVTSLEMNISNIQLSPSTVSTFPPIAATSLLTQLNYTVELVNDNGTGIGPALQQLGWTGVVDFNATNPCTDYFTNPGCAVDSINNTVWGLPNTKFLHPDGTDAIVFTGSDGNAADDTDARWMRFFRNSYANNLPGCYAGLPPGAAKTTEVTVTAQVVNVGDGDPTDDTAIIDRFTVASGPVNNPTRMAAAGTYNFDGSNSVAGSYTLLLQEILTGLKGVVVGTLPSAPDTVDSCQSAGGPVFIGQKFNFQPDNSHGFGIGALDTTVIFSIQTLIPPTSDTTPPFLISSNPQQGTTITDPKAYGGPLGADLTASMQDQESAIQPSTVSITLTDPAGNPVKGTNSNSGGAPDGSIVAHFHPVNALSSGGTYTMTANACNTGGLCLQKTVTFIMQDQTAPTVPTTGVQLISSTQLSPVQLHTDQTSPEGPFDNITQVWVQLNIDKSITNNNIDWVNSNVSLYQLNGSVKTAVPMVRQGTGVPAPAGNLLQYTLTSPISSAGQFEVDIQTFSTDAGGDSFSGPAVPLNPRFFTVVNNLSINIPYSNNPVGGLAVTGLQPVTITTGGLPVSLNSLQAILPDFTTIPADPGFSRLMNTTDNHQALQFNIGSGPTTLPLTFGYPNANPIHFYLYYNLADLPAGVTSSSLKVRGFDGSSWQDGGGQLTNAQAVTGLAYAILPPNGAAAFSIYALAYPSAGLAGVATATPMTFKSTRSFNPNNANAAFRKARFYYSGSAPKDVEVKVYDTAGTLIKSMALNAGVNPSDMVADPVSLASSYFFEWDGHNDNGDTVKNGLYLVRWRVTHQDGSADTQVKPVALIK
jgi:flagellar hook assembly protein FlgD